MNRFLLNTISRLMRLFKQSTKRNTTKTQSTWQNTFQPSFQLCSVVVVILWLSACSSINSADTANVDTGKATLNKPVHLQEQVYTVEQLHNCKNEADDIAHSALTHQSLPQYLLAAKRYKTCTQQFTHANEQLNDHKTTVMQLYVLSTVNFMKAGDLTNANTMVSRFKQAFPEQDFYFANYTSFIDTFEALLQPENITPQILATLNISSLLRQELLRKHYWLKN